MKASIDWLMNELCLRLGLHVFSMVCKCTASWHVRVGTFRPLRARDSPGFLRKSTDRKNYRALSFAQGTQNRCRVLLRRLRLGRQHIPPCFTVFVSPKIRAVVSRSIDSAGNISSMVVKLKGLLTMMPSALCSMDYRVSALQRYSADYRRVIKGEGTCQWEIETTTAVATCT